MLPLPLRKPLRRRPRRTRTPLLPSPPLLLRRALVLSCKSSARPATRSCCLTRSVVAPLLPPNFAVVHLCCCRMRAEHSGWFAGDLPDVLDDAGSGRRRRCSLSAASRTRGRACARCVRCYVSGRVCATLSPDFLSLALPRPGTAFRAMSAARSSRPRRGPCSSSTCRSTKSCGRRTCRTPSTRRCATGTSARTRRWPARSSRTWTAPRAAASFRNSFRSVGRSVFRSVCGLF